MKKSHENKFIYFISTFILFLVSEPFSNNIMLRIATVLILGVAVTKSLNMYSGTKTKLEARLQLKSFLEFLCAKISSGNNMENAFMIARNEFVSEEGKMSYISDSLKDFFKKQDRGESFETALFEMGKNFPCPEAHSLFEVLSNMRHLGSSNLLVIKQSLSMLSDILKVSTDISGDVSQKRLESTIMAVMPFVVVWSLKSGSADYMAPALSTRSGQFVLMIAFTLSVLSFCLGLYIVSQSVYSSSENTGSESKSSLIYYFKMIYRNLSMNYPSINEILGLIIKKLPADYIVSRKRILKHFYPDSDFTMEENIFEKICVLTFLTLIYIIVALFIKISPVPFAILAVFIIFYHDVEITDKIEKHKITMMRDLPGFIALMHTLLSSGMVLEKSLDLCIRTYSNSSSAFRFELNLLRSNLGSGIPVHSAVDKFADRIQIPEISGALILASRYSKSGDAYTLDLLKIQTGNCWTQAKISASRSLQKSSVKLLFPMAVELVCIMVITVTPAVLSFKVF